MYHICYSILFYSTLLLQRKYSWLEQQQQTAQTELLCTCMYYVLYTSYHHRLTTQGDRRGTSIGISVVIATVHRRLTQALAWEPRQTTRTEGAISTCRHPMMMHWRPYSVQLLWAHVVVGVIRMVRAHRAHVTLLLLVVLLLRSLHGRWWHSVLLLVLLMLMTLWTTLLQEMTWHLRAATRRWSQRRRHVEARSHLSAWRWRRWATMRHVLLCAVRSDVMPHERWASGTLLLVLLTRLRRGRRRL